jgi:ABC-2 type transport system permease protein
VFAEAAAAYRAQMLTTLNSELAQSGRLNTFDYVRGRDLWEQVPPFDYDAPPAAWALRRRWWSGAVLVAWLAAVSVAAVWAAASMRLE